MRSVAWYVVRLRRITYPRLDDKAIHIFAALGSLHAYLEKGKARIFGELPLQFSNEAPALIWNLSLPAWPQT
jgi:hypothetical protein